ncbi:MAG: hypothetical protein AMJ84_12290, partial [Acidithiobacillales bacterium SM23_46]
MATVQTLAVNLIARTSAFERQMRNSTRTIHTFGNKVTGISRTLTHFTRGILLAAGVGGLGYMLKRTMDTIDATAKLADRIGMTTESLTALQHAAKITGMEAESMNKAMEMFVRRMGEVKMGTGEAKRALETLKLSAEALASMAPIEALKLIADRVNQLETAAEKAAVAYYLFGRQGVAMLNLLAEGSEGIEAFREETEKLGLMFSRWDATKVEAANDALTRMRDLFSGIFQRVAIELAPYIELFATKVVKWGTAGEGMGAKVTKAFELMALGAIKVSHAVDNLVADLQNSQAALIDLQTSAWQLLDIMT